MKNFQELLEDTKRSIIPCWRREIARILYNVAHNVINGANIFNRFESVIETLQKTAPKTQDYMKSSLFHVLISCKDRK